ncbi:MAG: flavodoxin-dependent (E)-4-hydroxy-3-methylbut-2-enyl-diphosphate synthase [Clostridia bacterium]|nr:flavodoxin-dependent (E)-4-hydroxy-3-methylbut-2-enyl-diphosphate synthase [Clostridia bacterium]MBN2882576.1 flavodoxin-dependent (E)-4-hydroxy-3-methylbut-2-enyl-diphosphate synthase [Clostridia bacterium]
MENLKNEIRIGSKTIGGKHPVMIQSMTNTDTRDVDSTVRQIRMLAAAGCEMVRVTVPDMESANALGQIKNQVNIPVAADIHFDYRLAVASIENGADKIRINPGNIGSREKVTEVVKAARARNIPIRVGVNSGSLSKELYVKYGGATIEAMMDDLNRQIAMIEDMDYRNLVIAAKSSDIRNMVEINRLMNKKYNYPLHLGLTEAGTVFSGTIKSSAALGILLHEGIGNTIRYSLTADPVNEVEAAKVLLRSLGLYKKGINIISCPTCGRTKVDIISIANELEKRTMGLEISLDVAVMGCGVNGPNEARHADIGIAGGSDGVLLFKKGEIIKKVRGDRALDELMKLINEFNRGD